MALAISGKLLKLPLYHLLWIEKEGSLLLLMGNTCPGQIIKMGTAPIPPIR